MYPTAKECKCNENYNEKDVDVHYFHRQYAYNLYRIERLITDEPELIFRRVVRTHIPVRSVVT